MSEIDSESDENRDDVELEIKTNESDFWIEVGLCCTADSEFNDETRCVEAAIMVADVPGNVLG